MTPVEGPGWAPPGADPSAEQPARPFPPGVGGPSWPEPPPSSGRSPRVGGAAVTALVLAVVSLLVPLLPAIMALVLAATATRRIRQAPAAPMGGRGLVTAARALSTVGLLAWVGLGALVVTHQQEPTSWQAAAGTATDRAGQFSEVTTPPTTEPAATEPTTTEPATTQPKVAASRIGDRLTVYDESGAPRLEITVTGVKFSTGDQFDRPEHGLYMGAHVKVRALADEEDAPWMDSYALVGGRHYLGDAITGLNAFEPPLEPVTLNRGERASGWLVFDVPTRHGQLVLRDLVDDHNLGIWKY
jgi:hypothetical protein